MTTFTVPGPPTPPTAGKAQPEPVATTWLTLLGAYGSWGVALIEHPFGPRIWTIRSGESIPDPPPTVLDAARRAIDIHQNRQLLVTSGPTPPTLAQALPTRSVAFSAKHNLDGRWYVVAPASPPPEIDPETGATSSTHPCAYCERTFPSAAARDRHAEFDHGDQTAHLAQLKTTDSRS